MIKKSITAISRIAAVGSVLNSNLTYAKDKKPDQEISFNAALTSDYRYHGISQTRLQPALQGGADYAHTPTGFYIGTWLSTIKWINDAGGNGDLPLPEEKNLGKTLLTAFSKTF